MVTRRGAPSAERFAGFTGQERQVMVGEFAGKPGSNPAWTLLDGIETRLPRPPTGTPAAAG
jgi:hypothetical protein